MHFTFLRKNQLLFTAEQDIQNICSKILKPFGITYFNYLKVYNNGSCYLLATHSALINYLFKNKIPVAAPIEEKLINKKFNYLILPIGDYVEAIHYAKENLNLAYFIDLVDRYDDYIELFCFGSASHNSQIVNFYLNNLDILEKFKFYFKEEALNYLKRGEKNKIILSPEMYPPYQGILNNKKRENNSSSSLRPGNYYLAGKYSNIKLTQRQYDCLAHLAKGNTAKEIARNLNISFRTVENYIADLKSIFNCYKKSQLADIFLQNLK